MQAPWACHSVSPRQHEGHIHVHTERFLFFQPMSRSDRQALRAGLDGLDALGRRSQDASGC